MLGDGTTAIFIATFHPSAFTQSALPGSSAGFAQQVSVNLHPARCRMVTGSSMTIEASSQPKR